MGYNVLGILLLCLEGVGVEKDYFNIPGDGCIFGRGGFYLVGSF